MMTKTNTNADLGVFSLVLLGSWWRGKDFRNLAPFFMFKVGDKSWLLGFTATTIPLVFRTRFNQTVR